MMFKVVKILAIAFALMVTSCRNDNSGKLDHAPCSQQSFADWVQDVQSLGDKEKADAIVELFSQTSCNAEKTLELFQLSEQFFNDPNSPFRDEDLFIAALKCVINDSVIGEGDKERPKELLRVAMMNRPGSRASDFEYVDRDGRKGSLHKYLDGSPLTILYFFNPECADCERVGKLMMQSEVLERKLKEGEIAILALYPDEDLGAWNRHVDEYPSSWTVARYSAREDAEAYDLPAIPAFYLLDKGKSVVLKDRPIEEVIAYLENC